MDDCVLSYAAGIIDGEGYIGIRKANSGGAFRMRISVGNTDPRMLLFLEKHFGGIVRKMYNAGTGLRKKAAFEWTLSGTHAGLFLKLIYPYVVCKKEQIDVVLEYLNIKDWRRREELYWECRRLKTIDFGPKG